MVKTIPGDQSPGDQTAQAEADFEHVAWMECNAIQEKWGTAETPDVTPFHAGYRISMRKSAWKMSDHSGQDRRPRPEI
ncbi:MAG: hypothetical protein AB7G75_27055 [Candidatus Binatia bacterium]